MNWLTNIVSGGLVKSIETVALEAIQTDGERAEARLTGAQADAVLLKTLDPNGQMRRNVMTFVCRVYAGYLIITVPLILMVFFGLGDEAGAKEAMAAIKDTFLPITGLFTALATASFGVNGMNSYKGK